MMWMTLLSDKNVQMNNFCAHAARSHNKGSQRVGDEM